MFRRLFVLLGVAVATLALATSALALTVHVRVEGLNRTLYGAGEPGLAPFVGPLVAEDGSVHLLSEPTALGALEAASRRAEFYYRLRSFSFGLFVDRIGRYPAGGSSGWVYKVNGVSPPVGAGDYVLREGDRVLWYFATFGPAGGPPTLTVAPAGKGCFRAVLEDDAGRRTPARDVVFRLNGRAVRSAAGRICPAHGWTRVRATLPGAVRSALVFAR